MCVGEEVSVLPNKRLVHLAYTRSNVALHGLVVMLEVGLHVRAGAGMLWWR